VSSTVPSEGASGGFDSGLFLFPPFDFSTRVHGFSSLWCSAISEYVLPPQILTAAFVFVFVGPASSLTSPLSSFLADNSVSFRFKLVTLGVWLAFLGVVPFFLGASVHSLSEFSAKRDMGHGPSPIHVPLFWSVSLAFFFCPVSFLVQWRFLRPSTISVPVFCCLNGRRISGLVVLIGWFQNGDVPPPPSVASPFFLFVSNLISFCFNFVVTNQFFPPKSFFLVAFVCPVRSFFHPSPDFRTTTFPSAPWECWSLGSLGPPQVTASYLLIRC